MQEKGIANPSEQNDIIINLLSKLFIELKNSSIIDNKVRIETSGEQVGQINGLSIIGNGPYQTDLSEDIDSSFVVRCNNFKLRESERKLGTRTDLNISSLHFEIIPERKPAVSTGLLLPAGRE